MAYLSWLSPRARKLLVAAMLAAFGVAGSGCSSRNQAFVVKLQELEREVNALRADNLILKDRLEAIEDEAAETAKTAAAPVVAAAVEEVAPTDRPALAVVRLAPDAPAAEGAATVPGAPVVDERPVIVGDARGVSQQPKAAAGQGRPRGSSYKHPRR